MGACVLLVLFLVLSVSNSQILKKDQTTGKSDYILIAPRNLQVYIGPNQFLSSNPCKSPTFTYADTGNFINYCTYAIEMIQSNYSTLWSNLSFCQTMFCESENVLYIKYNNSLQGDQNLSSDLKLKYLSSFYICRDCITGMNQTFKNGGFYNCQWNNIALPKQNNALCGNSSIYIENDEFCYHENFDQYFNSPINIYVVLLLIMNDFHPYLLLFIFTILFINTIFVNLIPTIYDTIQKIKSNPLIETSEKFFTIFSLQNINLIIIIMIELQAIIISIFDRFIINYNITPIIYFFGFFLFAYCFIHLILILSLANNPNSINDAKFTAKEW